MTQSEYDFPQGFSVYRTPLALSSVASIWVQRKRIFCKNSPGHTNLFGRQTLSLKADGGDYITHRSLATPFEKASGSGFTIYSGDQL